MPISYRLLNASDSSDYRQLRLQCLKEYPDSFGSVYEVEKEKPKLAYEGFLEEAKEGTFIVGAYDVDDCVGICAFFRNDRKRTQHRGALQQIYVKPNYQGQGIAKTMIKKAMDIGFNELEVEQIALGVMSDNVAANKIYEDLGFVEYGMMDNYFKIGNRYLHQRLMVKNKH